jgi:hypothetical protein
MKNLKLLAQKVTSELNIQFDYAALLSEMLSGCNYIRLT